jgi:hypothetical protein
MDEAKPDPRKQYLMSHEVREALLSYLFQRPYAEVARGVDMLRELPEFVDPRQPAADVPALKLAEKG